MEKSQVSNVPKCRICHQRHALKDCGKFHQMDVRERREEVKVKGFCFKCLCSSHTRDWCRSRKTCLVCNQNHHTMLHTDTTSNSNRNITKIIRHKPVKPQHSSSGHHTTSNSRRKSQGHNQRNYIHERLSPRSKTHVFLPTALARVLAQNGTGSVRMMMNSAGKQTIILRSMVDRLNIRTTKKGQSEFCTLCLQSYHDETVKVQIIGLVKSHFNMALPEATTEKKLQSIYNHLGTLADPHFYKPSNIEVAIGNDQLSKLLLAGLIQTSSSMPIAQSTIFGWIISGACTY
ncbi:uncharacterized protein LOC142236493 [Haematobia irritans]|uniref:uncharacterized protein LOC142236424 n=1 Tax=Haematobia irritans TaxID=7368 RepID=UPI003F4FC1E0